MFRLLMALGLVVVGTSSPLAQPVGQLEAPIVGGQAALDGQLPWVAAVVVGDGLVVCSGVLVHPRVVLTAKHCVDPLRPDWVALDTSRLSEPGELVAVDEVFEAPSPLDAAALWLAEDAVARPARSALCEGWSPQLGHALVVAGYGAEQADGTHWASGLQVGEVEVVAPRCTDESWGCTAPDAELVAASADVDSCVGDSGGPLLDSSGGDDVVIALVSRGLPGEQACGQGGIYVRVDALRSWLQESLPLEAGLCPQEVDEVHPGGCRTHGPTSPLTVATWIAMLSISAWGRRVR